MKALILAGGDITLTDALKHTCQSADLIIAADSGLRHAAVLGVSPDIILGDFDSVEASLLAHYPDTPTKRHPPEKDLLDLELALDYAQEQGATQHLIVGGLGDRFDQSLAALLIAARRKREGCNVSLLSGHRAVYLLAGAETLTLETPPQQLFSLLSLDPVSTVGLRNAKYPLQDPLKDHALPFGVGLGVSNEVTRSPLEIDDKKRAGGVGARGNGVG